MATVSGKVFKVEDGLIHVRIPKGEGCGLCGSGEHCSFRGPESAYHSVQVPYADPVESGTRVRVEIPEKSQNIAVLIAFALPIFLILGSYLLVRNVFAIPRSELWGTLLGFVLYLGWLYLWDRLLSKLPSFTPRVVTLMEPGSGGNGIAEKQGNGETTKRGNGETGKWRNR